MPINVGDFHGADPHLDSFQVYAIGGGGIALSGNTFKLSLDPDFTYAALIAAGGGGALSLSDQDAPENASYLTYVPGGGQIALSANTFKPSLDPDHTYASVIVAGGGGALSLSDQDAPENASYLTYVAAGGLIGLTHAPFHALLDSEFPAGGGGGGNTGTSQIWSLG